MESLTSLIHRAYGAHGAAGLKYWATHQTVDDTRQRFAQGVGFVALRADIYVGTVTLREPHRESPVPLYREPDVWSGCQFAVEPDLRGLGIGRKLHDTAVAYARDHGARRIAFDTAKPAEALIRMYEGWGYRIVGEWDWQPFTNYESVVLAMDLG